MKQADIARLEARLKEEREQALRALRHLEEDEQVPPQQSSGDVSGYPSHMADRATDTEEEERDFQMATAESDTLSRIDAALELLYEDPARYQTCERCGKPIGTERLDIVPWTRLCAGCAREEEGAGGAGGGGRGRRRR